MILTALALFPQADREQADRLYRDRKFTQAAQVLEEHLSTQPEDFPARLLLGLCYQLAAERQKALAAFQGAVRRKPGDPDARYFLARVEYLLGRLLQADENARLSIRLGGRPARAYDLIGLVQSEQGLNEDALDSYDAAIRSDSEFAQAYFNSGMLLRKLGRAQQAVERLSTALRLNAQWPDARRERGQAYLELGRKSDAENDLAAAVSLGDDETARRLLAELRAGARMEADPTSQPISPVAPIRFRNVASAAGVRFAIENHPTPAKHLIETMPGGVASFDYNNDGRPDIYFTNGASIPSLKKEGTKYFNRLFRNDGGMRFTDVTVEAGVAGTGYSMGVAAADYDNDGNVDLYVAGVKRNILYRNLGDGKFLDVTVRAGIGSGVWSMAGGWFDYDNDGRLDLFGVNYLNWAPELDRYCAGVTPSGSEIRVYCHPQHFEGLPNVLFRNRGNGTFEDVSEKSGIGRHVGKGMSVAFADYDGDGSTDVFVANDTAPNFLFHNRGDGTFEEVALQAGVALTDDGKTISSMGVDFRDYDNDGLPDLAITALSGETFPLFRNLGKGFFRDVTYRSRVGLLSAKRAGWSNGLFDFNNDGWKDLFSANSHVMDNIDLLGIQRYLQPNSVFANRGNGTFEDLLAASFDPLCAHRGAAFADFNADGRLDVVVSCLGGPAELWENVSPEANHWLGVRLRGVRSNRDGIGARVRLGNQWNQMTSATGYASSSHGPVLFGLGKDGSAQEIEVRWPSGAVQTIQRVRPNQVLDVREPR